MQNLMLILKFEYVENLLMLKGAQVCAMLFVVKIFGLSRVTWGLKQKIFEKIYFCKV